MSVNRLQTESLVEAIVTVEINVTTNTDDYHRIMTMINKTMNWKSTESSDDMGGHITIRGITHSIRGIDKRPKTTGWVGEKYGH